MDAKPIRVLLIEDNPGDARLIQEMLREARGVSFAVDYADRLSAGLEVLAKGAIDVVLLDLGLPDVQGLETLVKTHERVPQVPILVLTGLDDEEVAVLAVQEGAQDYLVKGQIESGPLARAVRYAIGRKQIDEALRQSEERFRSFVEHAADSVFMVDGGGKIAATNPAAERMFGYRGCELVGQSIDILLPERLRTQHGAHRGGFMGAPSARAMGARLDFRALRKDGSEFPVAVGLTPLTSGEGRLVAATVADMTAQKLAEEALRATLEELEGRNQELESFTYGVSHDLKEPLRTVEAFSQFLLEDYAGRLDEQGKDYLTRMGKAAGRMKQMIEELLMLSRLARRPSELAEVDVAQVVADVTAAFQVAVQERSARIEIDGELPHVLGDASRVEQIFGNLIANALKFNHNATPTASVGLREARDGVVTFFVQDNGIGIDPAYHEQIFGVFQRLHPREQYEGTGAGLAIVKRAAEALGGSVWVESAPGAGATFLVRLPLWRPPGGVTPARAASTRTR